MPYLARSAISSDIPSQSYLEHVLHVLIRSREYLRKILLYARNWDVVTIRRILELAAEYHDLGKLFDENQDVLSGKKQAARLPLSHADAGVAYLLEQNTLLSALFVYAHHAGLPDYGEINIRGLRNTKIEQRVDQALPELLLRHEASVRSTIHTKNPVGQTPLLKPTDVRVLFSCLTHADHGDAARASNEEPKRVHSPKLRAVERLEALRHYATKLSACGDDSERNRMRSVFFDKCFNGTCKAAISICDAPVGTGKTTAVMSHLLNMAIRNKLRRIFVILPFTNIITQSVKTYRKALTLEGENAKDVVAEIHHRADFENPQSRKLTALWDAPIVVTTAVAFFETLASASSSRLRRLQNFPGSAVFLDEAHAMLPVKLLLLAWKWIQHSASDWSCCWVLASGSLCQFWTLEEFSDVDIQIPNLLPSEEQDNLHDFESMRVCHCYYPNRMNLNELAIWLHTLEGPVIVVLNTVHTAAAAAKTAEKVFGEGNVLHLSTSLTPADREITLDLVKKRLRHKSDPQWCLIATSCVEAGVDLSFRTGVRECASLLSLLQLAGRVNRNSEYEDSIVWTITLNANDSGVTRNPSLTVSSRILREFFKQNRKISPELCTDAMKREMREQGSISRKLCDDENKYAFKTIEKEFQMIEDDSQLTVINTELIIQIRNYENVSWQEIQNGSVRIRKKILDKLDIEESQRYPGVWLWPKEAKYSPFLGYMEAVLELDNFNKTGYAII
jgi:CRISPR-associated endonuclease/helicase Cas3